ncbi:MAG: fibronectin type III domain-containing protein [Oscillospiraceae bacterium]
MNIKKFAAFVIAAALLFGISATPTAAGNNLFISASAASELSAPSNIKAASGADKITLTWDKVNGADAYRIYMYDSYKKAFRKIKTVTENQAVIEGLKSDKSYRFMLSAVKKNGKSYIGGEFSSKFTVKTKSLGNKTTVLKEFYVQTVEKGRDLLYTFEYDKMGRLIRVVRNLCNSHAEEYEFRGETYLPSEYTIEYTNNKAILTWHDKEDTNSNVAEPIKSYAVTLNFKDNGNIDSVHTEWHSGNDITVRITEYKYDQNNNLISKSNVRKNNETGKLKVTNSRNVAFDKSTIIDKIGNSSNTNFIYKPFNTKINIEIQKQNTFILNYLLVFEYQEVWDEEGVYRFVY